MLPSAQMGFPSAQGGKLFLRSDPSGQRGSDPSAQGRNTPPCVWRSASAILLPPAAAMPMKIALANVFILCVVLMFVSITSMQGRWIGSCIGAYVIDQCRSKFCEPEIFPLVFFWTKSTVYNSRKHGLVSRSGLGARQVPRQASGNRRVSSRVR